MNLAPLPDPPGRGEADAIDWRSSSAPSAFQYIEMMTAVIADGAAADRALRQISGAPAPLLAVLHVLMHAPDRSLRVGEIQVATGLTRAGTTRAVDSAAARMFVSRLRSPEDGRGVVVRLRVAGVRAYEEAVHKIDVALNGESVVSELGDEDGGD